MNDKKFFDPTSGSTLSQEEIEAAKASSETMISGSIVVSTVEQLYLLGDVGEEILAKADLPTIDPNHLYPRSIRGNIHQEILDRFGDAALFHLGLEQFNNDGFDKSFPKMVVNTLGCSLRELYKKQRNENRTEEEAQRVVREGLLKAIATIHSVGDGVPIIAKTEHIRGTYDFLSDDTAL